MMRSVPLLLVAALVGACAGLDYVGDDYEAVAHQTVQMPDDIYRIYDEPAQNKLRIVSTGTAIAHGFGRGFAELFQRPGFPAAPPRPPLHAAALEYLRQSGREGCKVVESYPAAKQQLEVKYECRPAAPQVIMAPAAPGRRRRN
jgi:hypothetical protein